MSTEAKRRRALEGAGSTSTGMREAGDEEEEDAEDEARRPKRPRLGDGGGDDDDDDEAGLEEDVEASSPSLSVVRPLSSVADTAVSSSRDRSAAREVQGPRERSGLARMIGEGRRRGCFVGVVEDATGKRCCWCFFSAVCLHSSSPPVACRRACDIVSSRVEAERLDQEEPRSRGRR